jgi:hypothetical protein
MELLAEPGAVKKVETDHLTYIKQGFNFEKGIGIGSEQA